MADSGSNTQSVSHSEVWGSGDQVFKENIDNLLHTQSSM